MDPDDICPEMFPVDEPRGFDDAPPMPVRSAGTSMASWMTNGIGTGTGPFTGFGNPAVTAPTDTEVEQAFQVPAAVFDLELPWTVKQGLVCNKFGVRIGSFKNWEQADAVVAMMNASHQMLETMAAMQTAAEPAVEPAPPAPVEPKSATRATMETLLKRARYRARR